MNRYSRGISLKTMSGFWKSPGGYHRRPGHGSNTTAVSPPFSKTREALAIIGSDRSLFRAWRSASDRLEAAIMIDEAQKQDNPQPANPNNRINQTTKTASPAAKATGQAERTYPIPNEKIRPSCRDLL